jgi:hypothetical protein
MRTLRIAATLGCCLATAACFNNVPPPAPTPAVDTPVATQLELRDQTRQLWAQRAFWTRVYIVDVLGEFPSRDATLQQLNANQVALGEALKPFYGDAAGSQYTQLLQDNINVGNRLIVATKEGSRPLIQDLTTQWIESTARIADFLADQNPSLNRDELQLQLQGYRDVTGQQVNERLAKNWEADIAAADASMHQARTFADVLAAGMAQQFPQKVTEPTQGTNEQTLHVELRELWVDHGNWERLFMISDLSQLPDLTATSNRLMANPIAIGEALKPFYGNTVGTKMGDLLTQHVALASDVIRAAQTGNEETLAAAKEKWFENADELGAFIGSLGPFLVESDMQIIMRAHCEQLVTEARARVSGDYVGEIAAHDIVEHHLLVLSDSIVHAISSQFSGNFKPEG